MGFSDGGKIGGESEYVVRCKNTHSYEYLCLGANNEVNTEDGAITYAIGATGINLYTLWDGDIASCCQHISARPHSDDGVDWVVSFHYGPYNPRMVENPFLRPARFQCQSIESQVPCEYDAFQKPILNSCYDPFDPPLMKDQSNVIFIVTQAEHIAPDVRYNNTINSNDYYGYAAKTLKVTLTAEDAYEESCGPYWLTTYRFQYKPQNMGTWIDWVQDKGWRAWNMDAPDPNNYGFVLKTNILNNGVEQITSPRLLDGSGFPLTEGGEPVYFPIHKYLEVPFPWVIRLPVPS